MPKRREQPKMRYLPGMAAFQVAGETVTGSSNGCLRRILFSAFGLRDGDIHPVYKEIGEMNELRHQDTLIADPTVLEVQREEPIRMPVFGSKDVTFSGRRDFVVTYEDDSWWKKISNWVTGKRPHVEIHECKATASKSLRTKLRKGEPKLDHVAQLLSYMIHEEITKGRLIYGFYEYKWQSEEAKAAGEPKELHCTETHVIPVEIAPTGQLLVNGQPIPFTVSDQLKHMQAATKVLTDRVFNSPRPACESEWSNACRWCPFQNTCNKIDVGMVDDLDSVLASAEYDINVPKEEKEPNIFQPKRRPKGA